MQCHIMKLNIEAVEALNSGQAPVDTSDFPIFVLIKKVTYCFPNQFSYYFAMFGGLHIEQCLLRVHSQLIENNNSNKIFEICSLAATGVEAVIDINYIKRARYCSKATLWALH